MPKGVKRGKRILIVKGQGGWKQKPPLHIETTHDYLWVGRQTLNVAGEEDGDPEYLFSASPAQARKIAQFILDELGVKP